MFLSQPACVSETPMSLSGSCRYGEAASSHACLISTKSTVPLTVRMDYMGTIWRKAENERRWSVTAATERRTTLQGQMTGLAGGHQSCNDVSVKFPFLFLKYIHPPCFIFLSFQPQTPTTGMRGDEADLQPPSCIRGCHIMPNYHAVARRGPMGWLQGGQDGWIRSVER